MTTPTRPPRVVPLLVLRAFWLVLPLLVGPALGSALDARSAPVQGLAAVATWGTWAGLLVALMVPRATSLTALRVGAPAALAASVAAALADGVETWEAGLAVLAAAVVVALVAAPPVADAFVDGSSYGSERRFALRTPLPLLVLAVATWVVVAAAVVTGPLLLAARQWVLGGVLTVVGAAAAYAGVRSLHGLSRRWLVLVPSGVVVHDPVGRPDSVMAPRPLIVRLGPAPAATDALDLTLGAAGLALELETAEPLPVTVRRSGRDIGTEPATRVLVAVSRPAAVLAEASARKLPVA